MNKSMINHLNQLSVEYEDMLSVRKVTKYNSPLNVDEEKQKFLSCFLSGDTYNPQFIYRDTPENWITPFANFRKRLKPDNFWEKLLFEDVNHILAEMEAIAQHSPQKITSETIWAYGIPSQELIEKAKEILMQPVSISEDERKILDTEAAVVLEQSLNKAGLDEWRVEIISDMNARMMVQSSEKRVYVREGTKFSSDDIKRLLVHEIGTHVFRYINGENQKLKFLRMGLLGYLFTEEGLATYHEKKYNVQDVATLRRYALRVLAAAKVLSESFFDVFFDLVEFTSDFDDLFDIVKRAKRGMCDTRNFGGHLKDQVYLKGFLEVTDYIKRNELDYQYLMVGKVSLEMVPQLKKLENNGVVEMPTFLPNNLI